MFANSMGSNFYILNSSFCFFFGEGKDEVGLVCGVREKLFGVEV